ncbi:winged helix-turn-helix transcriptional regulator [Chryseobacterium sp. FH1]|uniref:winged helix-turn-helix transcriptional regulator n=1 Tax=Chryseobacterium sp. FH1 TaxID=1233951 RepID=UPI000975A2F2|nr:winged helix-turn-helix transcriptional regulator [Chryseobacterium sp. FH1]
MRKENSTNSLNEKILEEYCNAHKILSQISGRWKISLIFILKNEHVKYSEFKLTLPNVTDRILTKQLKELEANEIVINSKDKIQPTYSLTIKGKKILDYLDKLNEIDFENQSKETDSKNSITSPFGL